MIDVHLGQVSFGDVVGVDDGIRPYALFFLLWLVPEKGEAASIRRRPHE